MQYNYQLNIQGNATETDTNEKWKINKILWQKPLQYILRDIFSLLQNNAICLSF